jgi:hypothetical protein
MANALRIIEAIDAVLPELQRKEQQQAAAWEYAMIARQLEFVRDCFVRDTDYRRELNGRELNFALVASRHFAGPEEDLLHQIGRISTLLNSWGK